jgi:MoaA/NifB/PqqE/SkfB family radical SAM enzyme
VNVLRRLKTRFYVPSPEDALPARLWRSATSRRVPEFPRTVQFETHSACNGACVFCPYPATAESQPRGFMKRELFEKIVDEVAKHPVRRISPFLNNEPFLDPDMVQKLRYIRERVPGARIVLTTNGSRLDPQTVDAILERDVLHSLFISFQGVEKEAYEASMRGGLVFEQTLANVENLIERWKTAGGKRRFRIVVTMVATNQIDLDKAARYWRARGVESQWTALENRGGNVAAANSLAPTDRPFGGFGDCTRLFKQAYILFNGDMVLCCTDYTRKMVLGNVGESSIEEVWNGPMARSVRRLFAEGRFHAIPLCANCEISRNGDGP